MVLKMIKTIVECAVVVLIASINMWAYMGICKSTSKRGEIEQVQAIKTAHERVTWREASTVPNGNEWKMQDAEYSQARSANEGAAHGVGLFDAGLPGRNRNRCSASPDRDANDCPCNSASETQPISDTQRRRRAI